MTERRAHSADLTDRLKLAGDLRKVTDRVGQHDEALSDFADQLAGFGDDLEKLKGDRGDAPPAFWWGDLEPAARAKHWASMTGWVETVLRPWHPAVGDLLRPCWTTHRPAVAAVTACWQGWIHAHRGKGRKGNDPSAWQRDGLKTLRVGLQGVFGDGPVMPGRESQPCTGCQAVDPAVMPEFLTEETT